MSKKEIIATLINGSESAIKDYLDRGGDPNLRDERGHPILTASILFNRNDIALALLAAGADTKTIDQTGRSVFYTSCAKSCYDVFQALGPESQDVNERVPVYGFTPLMGACSNPFRDNEEKLSVEEESFQIAKRLIELGADVSARDSDGETALHRAATHISDKCTRLLIENGSEIDPIASNLETPLSCAAFAGSGTNVQLLLKKGANPNQILNHGYTPLAWAANNGHEECVDILISHGGKIFDNKGFTVKGFLEYLKNEKGNSNIISKLEKFKSGRFIATAAEERKVLRGPISPNKQKEKIPKGVSLNFGEQLNNIEKRFNYEIYYVSIAVISGIIGLSTLAIWFRAFLETMVGIIPLICIGLIGFSGIKLKDAQETKNTHLAVIVISGIVGILVIAIWFKAFLETMIGIIPIICIGLIGFSGIKLKDAQETKNTHLAVIVISGIVGTLVSIIWIDSFLTVLVAIISISCVALAIFLMIRLFMGRGRQGEIVSKF